MSVILRTLPTDVKKMTRILDKADRKILNLLQTNSQMPNAQIAEQVGLSASSCWRKINALDASGIIENYTVTLNPRRAGLDFEAIVHLQLDRHDSDGVSALSELLGARPEVVDCFATTGTADYQMRVLCKDLEAYNIFLEEVLFRNSSVRSAQTNVVLKRIKSSGKITL
jgi:Lrp/AsnC family leucine-responsive transcriptional regulator